MRYHSQNLTYDRLPTWRHGCAWWGNWHAEWHTFHDSHLLGVALWWCGFSIRLRWLSLYLRARERKHDGEWSVSWHDGALWIDHPWVRQMEWRSADPWWRKNITLPVVDWLIGKASHECVKGEPREVFVPMPEGSYRAVATPETRTWRHRWYWPVDRRESVWLDIPGGIPCSGKGENSWDCDDDGLFGCGGATPEEAIAHAVSASLMDRRRQGYDSRGTGRTPALVVNATKAAS